MTKSDQLSHHFLVAMPTLQDPSFSKSVIYLCEHNEQGAFGVIINKPHQLKLGNVLKHLDITCENDEIRNHLVFMGGPVGQEHGFIFYPSEDDADQISISASTQLLTDIAKAAGPNDFLVTLGYSGWSSGQLENELSRNDWLITPPDPHIMFATPVAKRWSDAAQIIGVDLSKLTSHTGHA